MALDNRTINKFSRIIDLNREAICKLAVSVSGAPISGYYEDIEYIKKFLSSLKENRQVELSDKYVLMPKGCVLIGVSSNDPIINSTIPIISALRAGNKVVMRPSSKTLELNRLIYGYLMKSGVKASDIWLRYVKKEHTPELVRDADFVYWAGSSKVCRRIAVICSKLNKKFYLESEGKDIAIIDSSVKDLTKVARILAKDMASHNGERCQTVRGIYAHEKVSRPFRGLMIQELMRLRQGRPEDRDTEVLPSHKKQLISGIRTTRSHGLIWIKEFKRYPELADRLGEDNYGLALSIFSSRNFNAISKDIIKKVRFSRVNFNKTPGNVSVYDPWGGIKKSGMSGPQPWVNKFVDRMYINK